MNPSHLLSVVLCAMFLVTRKKLSRKERKEEDKEMTAVLDQ